MRIVFPSNLDMEKAGYSALAHCPFLVSDDGTYQEAANRYLRERALAEWIPTLKPNQQDEGKGNARYLTAQTCGSISKLLRYFLMWCASTQRDWRTVTYTEDLVFTWQRDLLNGTQSASGNPLDPKTVNLRVSEATYFLVWAQERGLRGPVRVPLTGSTSKAQPSPRAGGRQPKRAGAVRVSPSQLALPSVEAVGQWLAEMLIRKGTVKRLCTQLIVETGIRLQECIRWRVTTLPPRREWRVIDDTVEVMLRYGCKGPKVLPSSDESIRPRAIMVPLALAEKIDHYRHYQRPVQLRRWVAAGDTPAERRRRERLPHPDLLWLGPRSNRPFTASQLYQDWVGIPSCPKGWHPHAGREFFAVETLVRHTRAIMDTQGVSSTPGLDWLYGMMASQVRIILQPQMGHVSEDTTHIYLRALRMRLAQEVGHPSLRWQSFCEDESGAW